MIEKHIAPGQGRVQFTNISSNEEYFDFLKRIYGITKSEPSLNLESPEELFDTLRRRYFK